MKLILALCALACSVSLSYAAEGEGPRKDDREGGPPGGRRPPEDVFKELDTNADSAVSKEEFLAGRLGQKDPEKAAEVFARKDKDGDGKLSLEEFKKGGGPGGPGGGRRGDGEGGPKQGRGDRGGKKPEGKP